MTRDQAIIWRAGRLLRDLCATAFLPHPARIEIDALIERAAELSAECAEDTKRLRKMVVAAAASSGSLHETVLGESDAAQVREHLENPPEPNEALRDLFREEAENT